MAKEVFERTKDHEITPFPVHRGEIPEWPKGSDCKSDGSAFTGSNPVLPTTRLPRPAQALGGEPGSFGGEPLSMGWPLATGARHPFRSDSLRTNTQASTPNLEPLHDAEWPLARTPQGDSRGRTSAGVVQW